MIELITKKHKLLFKSFRFNRRSYKDDLSLTGFIYRLIISIFFILYFSSLIYAESISDLEELMLKGNYTNSIYVARRLLEGKISSSQERYIYYLMGLSYLKLGSTKMARESFPGAISKSKDSLTIKSLIGIADSYFLDKDFHEAIDKYQNILSKYTKIDNESNLYFKLAQSYLKIGDWETSKKYFRKVKKNYPLSFDASLAKDILDENVFYFTVQVGSFTNRDNAKKLYYRLKKDDYPVYIYEREINHLTFYRVRVGKFNTKEKAYILAGKLKRAGLPTKIYP